MLDRRKLVSWCVWILASLVPVALSAQERDAPAPEWLRRLDRDGDGKLTLEELPGRFRRAFGEIDVDGDGALTFEEVRAFRAARAAASQDARLPEEVELRADIPYAGTGNPRQALDLLLPRTRRTDGPAPVIAFIHGGAWRAGDRRSGRGRLAAYVKSGDFAGVSIGYRLSQEAVWPAQIHDCKAAIRWIRANASKYGLDAGRIAVWGTSAGGHLASMLGVSAGVEELEGKLGPHTDVGSEVRCVVNFFGPSQLLRMGAFPSQIDHEAADSPESQLVGGPILERRTAALSASPLIHVSGDDAPFLTVHGTKDPLVPFNQAEILHAALRKAGVRSILIRVEGAGHGFRSPQVEQRARTFIEHHLLGKKPTLVDETIPERPRG